MNGNHNTQKTAGSILSHDEWNALATDVNELSQGGAGALSTQVDQVDQDKTVIKINNVLVGELTDKQDKGVNVRYTSSSMRRVFRRAIRLPSQVVTLRVGALYISLQ